MAFDYTTANTGLFVRIGKLTKYINSHLADATTTLPADEAAIVAPFNAAGVNYEILIDGITGVYEGFKANVTAMRQQLASYIDACLQDSINVLPQLPAIDNNLQTSVLPALFARMITDAQTINRSTVTLGSVTAASGNNGNGTFLVTKVLDGYNSPIIGAPAIVGYNGLDSELAVPSETMQVQCVSDSERDGATEGEESFHWIGGIQYDRLDYHNEGSGDGGNVVVQTSNGQLLLTDGDFENWGGTGNNTPTNWAIDAGTAGTHVFRESTTIYRNTYAAKLHGDGAQASITLGQAVSTSLLKNKQRYCVALRLRVDTIPASGNFVAKFTGTGYAASSVTDEVQTLQISGTPTGGTYTISWVGPYKGTQTTAPIAYNATSATVQTALRALTGLESVVVSTLAGAPPNVTHQITFYGVPGNVNQITADITGLTGGTPAKTIATTTPGVEGEQINLPAAAFPAVNTWVLRWFWINTPAVIPSDFRLTIGVTGTLSNNANVFVDSVQFTPVQYHGGVGVVGVPGSTRFLDGDTFTWTVTNDQAGVFQELFRKQYSMQLPSSGSPTINDSLAM